MKKNIGLVTLDSSLVQWLHEKLRLSGPKTREKEELLEGLEDLMNGTAASLMLELGGEEMAVPVSEVIQCGALAIYVKARKVTREREEISLTPKEFDILCFLARNRGEVFTKEQIYEAVWDDIPVSVDAKVECMIYSIRKKLRKYTDREYIQTVWGVGYKFDPRT